MADVILIVLSCLFVFPRTTKKDGRHPESDKLKRLRFAINVVFIHFPDRQTCHLFCSEILSPSSPNLGSKRLRDGNYCSCLRERRDTGTLTTFIRDVVDHNMIIDDTRSRDLNIIPYKLKLSYKRIKTLNRQNKMK